MMILKTLLVPMFTATLALLMAGSHAAAQTQSPPVFPMSEVVHSHPEIPPVLPLRNQASVIDRILEDRLETIIPQTMREQGVSMWVLMSREYFEEPVVESLLDARSMAARRRIDQREHRLVH